MTVGELRERLAAWPQDANVARVADNADGLGDFEPVTSTSYWAAYDEGYVVID